MNFVAVFIDSLNSYLINIFCAPTKKLTLKNLDYLQKYTKRTFNENTNFLINRYKTYIKSILEWLIFYEYSKRKLLPFSKD